MSKASILYIVYIYSIELKEGSSVYSVYDVCCVWLDRIYGVYMSKVSILYIVYIYSRELKEGSSVYSVYGVCCVWLDRIFGVYMSKASTVYTRVQVERVYGF